MTYRIAGERQALHPGQFRNLNLIQDGGSPPIFTIEMLSAEKLMLSALSARQNGSKLFSRLWLDSLKLTHVGHKIESIPTWTDQTPYLPQ